MVFYRHRTLRNALLIAFVLTASTLTIGDAVANDSARPLGNIEITEIQLGTDPGFRSPAAAEATLCDGEWQGPSAVYLPSSFLQAPSVFAVYQDPVEAGCPNVYPFEVTAVDWIMQAGAGGIDVVLRPVIWEVDLTDPQCPVPGDIMTTGPSYPIVLTPGGWKVGMPLASSSVCVFGPYFAGVEVVSEGPGNDFGVVLDDGTTVPPRTCANYLDYGSGWSDFLTAVTARNLRMFSYGYNADSNSCSNDNMTTRCFDIFAAGISLELPQYAMSCFSGSGLAGGTMTLEYEQGPYTAGQTIQTEITEMSLTGDYSGLGPIQITPTYTDASISVSAVDGSGNLTSGTLECVFDYQLDAPGLGTYFHSMVPYVGAATLTTLPPPSSTVMSCVSCPAPVIEVPSSIIGNLCSMDVLFPSMIPCFDCCLGRTSDVDMAGALPNEIDSSDLGLLVAFLFDATGTVVLPCVPEADVNASGGPFPGSVDSSDLGVLTQYLFSTPGSVTLPVCP